MGKHRYHDCNEWENYDIIKQCVAIMKPYKMESKETYETIHNYCVELETVLKNHFRASEECRKFLSDIEKLFGKISSAKDFTTIKKFDKMLKVLSTVIGSYHDNADYNVDLL